MDYVTFPEDPKSRPISTTHLSTFLKEDPETYKEIAKYCILSIAGIDSLKISSQNTLVDLMEDPVDLFIKNDHHRVDIYIDPNLGIWTYVASYYDYQKAFLLKKKYLNFMAFN